jgi:anti-sigma-K factor RskA
LKLNKNNIINDGYLEAYLTGDLSAEESDVVSKMIADDKEVAEAYYHVQKQLEHLTFAYAIQPSQRSKSIVLSKTSGSFSRFFWIAASLTSFIVSLGISLIFYNKQQQAEQELLAIKSEKSLIADQLNMTSNLLNESRRNNELLAASDFRKIVLNGTENAPQAKLVVFWNEFSGDLLVARADLAPLSSSQQYQLWAIIDGKPVDAGVFNQDDVASTLPMKKTLKAQAFAVTIEPAGGSASPSLHTMQVIGYV